MNLEIRGFEQKIIHTINESALPIEAKRLVLRDVLQQVESVADEQITKEYALLKENDDYANKGNKEEENEIRSNISCAAQM